MQSQQIHDNKMSLLKYQLFLSFIPNTHITITKGKGIY